MNLTLENLQEFVIKCKEIAIIKQSKKQDIDTLHKAFSYVSIDEYGDIYANFSTTSRGEFDDWMIAIDIKDFELDTKSILEIEEEKQRQRKEKEKQQMLEEKRRLQVEQEKQERKLYEKLKKKYGY